MANVNFTIQSFFKSKAVNKALSTIAKLGLVSKKTGAQSAKSSKKAESGLKRMGVAARRAAAEMNKILGGRGQNFMGGANNLGQNISSISNRLGFMAFQWNFMANAANRAVDMVIGGLSRIIKKGAETNDAVIRALAFSTPAQDLRNFTDAGIEDLKRMNELIRGLGSGQGIFGRDIVAKVAEQIQKAADDLEGTEIILPFALKIKTLDPTINDERLATGVISGLKALGVNIRDQKEVAKAFDLIANIADKTTANFQSTIASFAKAAPIAKTLGFTATETALALQLSFDTLARNKSSGRAGQSAGIIFQSFTRDLKELAVEGSKAQRFFAANDIVAFVEGEDGQKNLKPLVPLMQEFGRALAPLDDQARAAFLELSGFESLSQDFILAAIQEGDNLQAMQDSFKERGTLTTRTNAVMASGLSQIKRMEAAIDSLKATFVEGIRPILLELAETLSGIAGDTSFLKFIQDIGKFMAEDLIPIVRFIVRQFNKFFNIIKKNKKTLKFLTRSVLLLVGALVGLSVLATVAFFALVAAGSFFGMGGQALLAAGGLRVLAGSALGTAVSLLPVLGIGIGIGLMALALSGILEDKLAVAFGVVGVAITAVSTALLLGPVRLKAFGTAVTTLLAKLGAAGGLKATLIAASAALANFGGGTTLSGGFVTKQMGVKAGTGYLSGISTALRGIGRTHIILAVAAIGALAIIGFIKAMETRVEASVFFKAGGPLVSKWQQVGFQMTAATNVFLRSIGQMFRDIAEGIVDVWLQLATFQSRIIGSIIKGIIVAITSGDFEKAWKTITDGLSAAFDDFDIGKTIFGALDPTGAFGALDEIENRLKTFQQQGLSRFDPIVVESLKEVLDAFQLTDQTRFDISDQVRALLDQFLPDTATSAIDAAEINMFNNQLDPDVIAAINEESQKQVDALGELNPVLLEGVLSWEEINKIIKEQVKTDKKINQAITAATKATDFVTKESDVLGITLGKDTDAIVKNILARDSNTFSTSADTDIVQKDIEILSLHILEIARNTNKFIEFGPIIEQAKLAFLKLAIEGTEAARRLASLTVSTSGKFSISGRKTQTSFADIGILNKQIVAQLERVAEAFLDLDRIINIGDLQSFLTAVIEEAKKVAQENEINFVESITEDPDKPPARIDDPIDDIITGASFLAQLDQTLEELNAQLNPRDFFGQTVFRPGDNGTINIQVGGKFDIDITQDLSAEEVAELIVDQVTSSLRETEILKALKLTS